MISQRMNKNIFTGKTKQKKSQTESQKQSDEIAGLTLCTHLSKLDFWCGDDTLHIEKPDTYQDEFCCMTHVVGLPRHPATNQEMPLTPYQIEFVNEILKHSKQPIDKKKLEKFLRTPNFYHINKGRQMGFTEIVLRLIQYFCFSKYAGYNVGIIAATNGNLAKKDLRRFARLFRSIPSVVDQWIKQNTFKIVNKTIVEAFAASEEAITGDTRYKCIFKDESAKWRMTDDTPVFNSVEPIIKAAGGDLFLVSTPKGPLKTFYKITQTKNAYIRLEYNIWRTKGNLYTEEEIQNMLHSATTDPNQEYLCKFTIGEDSILGEITPQDKHGKDEWIIDDDEDDNYLENNEDDEKIHEEY